jgi:hypothetical protein
MSFHIEKYQVVKQAISQDLCNYLNSGIEVFRQFRYISEGLDPFDKKIKNHFNDAQINNSFSTYGNLLFESLLVYLNPLMNQITGLKLLPAYSYARIYYKGAEMTKHVDRPSCEYSCTLNLYNHTKPWKIYFENVRNANLSIKLHPGDCIVYKGGDLPHWRLPHKGKQVNQVFLHYVDSEGPHSDFIFDKRRFLNIKST